MIDGKISTRLRQSFSNNLANTLVKAGVTSTAIDEMYVWTRVISNIEGFLYPFIVHVLLVLITMCFFMFGSPGGYWGLAVFYSYFHASEGLILIPRCFLKQSCLYGRPLSVS